MFYTPRYRSPAEKARDTRLKNACWATAKVIHESTTHDEVIAAFKAVSKSLRADVFWQLDEHPANYPVVPSKFSQPSWHSLLRSVRNTPVSGRELFALWA